MHLISYASEEGFNKDLHWVGLVALVFAIGICYDGWLLGEAFCNMAFAICLLASQYGLCCILV